MKNTLSSLRFLAGVTLAGLLSAAQGIAQVYSLNIIGYGDVNLVAGSNLVANPLNAGNNAISNVFRDLPSGSFYLPWDTATQSFGTPNQFAEGTGWSDGAAQLIWPVGGFLWLPVARKISLVGEPSWPLVGCANYPAGTTVSGMFPELPCEFCFLPCPEPRPDGTIASLWRRDTQSFTEYFFIADFGWYPDKPILGFGEAAMFVSPRAFGARSLLSSSGPVGPAITLRNPLRTVAVDGSKFSFRFWAPTALDFMVQRSSGQSLNAWSPVLQQSAPPGGGWVTITDTNATNAVNCYRVDTLITLQMMNPARVGSTFRFQFYSKAGVTYKIRRTQSLTPQNWQVVQTVTGTGENLMTVTDTTATNSTGYYRLEY